MSFQFPHFILLLAFALAAPSASATDVSVVGLFAGKGAVVVIDGAPPRSLKLGQKTADGVELIAVDRETATLEVDGKRKTLRIGQHHAAAGSGGLSGAAVTLSADRRGQFIVSGAVNGEPVRFVVDTGASLVSLPAAAAQKININYKGAIQVEVDTANGTATGWKVKLDSVKVGDIELNRVDAVVMDSGLPIALLGMSFLNQLEMKRSGPTMTLQKRF